MLKKTFAFFLTFASSVAIAQSTFPNGITVSGKTRISNGTISSLNSNGDITITPAGTGAVALPNLTSSTVLYVDANKKMRSTSDIGIFSSGTINTAQIGVVPIAKGGSGQTTATAAFNALSPANTRGMSITSDGTNNVALSACADGNVLQYDSTQAKGIKCANAGGSVFSVGLTTPPFLTTAGSPVTTAGTFAITLSGSALPVANGGTGGTTATAARSALGVVDRCSWSANTCTSTGDTVTPFVFTVKDHDTGSQYNNSTGVATISAACAGVYLCGAATFTGATATTSNIYKSGVKVAQSTGNLSSTISSISYLMSLVATDTVDIRPGATATASAGASLNFFWCARIGPN